MLSATTALIAGWNIVATRTLQGSTALWVVFAGGITVLLLSLRALALHEATVERVVHALKVGASEDGSPAIQATSSSSPVRERLLANPGSFGLPAPMRSVAGLADTHRDCPRWNIRGPLNVRLAVSTASVSTRWLAFGLGIMGAAAAIISLTGQLLPRAEDLRAGTGRVARFADAGTTLVGGAVSGALVTHDGSDAVRPQRSLDGIRNRRRNDRCSARSGPWLTS